MDTFDVFLERMMPGDSLPVEEHDYFYHSSYLYHYSSNVVEYVADFVAKSAEKRVPCGECKEALYGSESTVSHLI